MWHDDVKGRAIYQLAARCQGTSFGQGNKRARLQDCSRALLSQVAYRQVAGLLPDNAQGVLLSGVVVGAAASGFSAEVVAAGVGFGIGVFGLSKS